MDTNTTELIASVLRSELAERKVSQVKLAEKLGVSPVSLSRYLHGQRDMPAGLFFDLLKEIGADAAELSRRIVGYSYLDPQSMSAADIVRWRDALAYVKSVESESEALALARQHIDDETMLDALARHAAEQGWLMADRIIRDARGSLTRAQKMMGLSR